MIINIIAGFLRSVNAQQVGEERWVVQKMLKIFYAISLLLHKLKLGRENVFLVINNFDKNLRLKINKSWSMGFSIYWSGFHEFHEFLFLHKFLKKSMVFVDIGANLGEYTVFVAKRLPAGRVLAFEPLPKMQKLLTENIGLNDFKHVSMFPYGLSDKEGILPIHEIEHEHEGLSTFYPGERITRHVFSVPLKTFDSEFPQMGVSTVDFIKLDIEGGELFALKGAVETIRKFRPVVMVEINGPTYAAAGYTVKDVYSFFEELKYRPFEINKQGDLIPSLSIPEFENIVFRPQ